MGLFKKERSPDLPSPPNKFSDMPGLDDEDDFPKYNPTMNFDEHNDEVSKVPQIKMPKFKEGNDQIARIERKPLFIKIDKYEDAVAILNSIKDRLDDATLMINELREIRRNEDTQLDEWSEHIKSVKEKLVNLDNTLFE